MANSLTGARKCFISAPFGLDTSALRRELEQRNISWSDQTTIAPGSSIIDIIDSEILSSDFVCVIITENSRDNVMFELGIAYARHKPILAFTKKYSDFLSDIHSLTCIHSDSSNVEVVSAALDTFLRYAKKAPPRRNKIYSAKISTISNIIPTATNVGQQMEKKTAALFHNANIIYSEQRETPSSGADFAIWVDELVSSLGNPILVEVKSGRITQERLHSACEQLKKYLGRVNARYGIVVYWDEEGKEFPSTRSDTPFIFQISGNLLINLLSSGQFAQELLRLRNVTAHGRV